MDNNTEKTNLAPVIFYLFLFLCTGGVGVIADVLLRHYTGRGIKERLDL